MPKKNKEERKAYLREWYLKNRDYARAQNRKRYLEKFKYDPRKRRQARLARYGLTEGTFDALLAAQDGKCAICGRSDSGTDLHDSFNIDHDHKTGAVRGLLCQPCNQGLGAFTDNPESLAAAIRYLAKWGIQ